MKVHANKIECSLLLLAVIIIWGVGCAWKSIYPFGSNYMDVADMHLSVVPVYTFFWDVLHGDKVFFFDWNIVGGNNMMGVNWHFTLFSPLNIFLLFIKREWIEKALFYFLLFKLMMTALSVRFTIRKWFSDFNSCFLIAFSLFYVFCPFSMEYYIFPAWYDNMFMFPLVMYYYFEVMRFGKIRGFTVCLTLFAMMNFQQIFSLAILLCLMTGGLLICDKQKYGNKLFLLIKSVIVSIGLSAWIWMPGIMQIMAGKRFDNKEGILDIWNSIWIFCPSKWLKLFNLGIPLVFFIWACIKEKQNMKVKAWYGYLLLMLGLPIILESSNMLWHGGSYQGYTMRFSYMLTFWCLMAGIWGYQIIKDEYKVQGMTRKDIFLLLIVGVILIGMFLYLKGIGYNQLSMLEIGGIIILSMGVGIAAIMASRFEKGIILSASVVLSLLLVLINVRITTDNDIETFYEIEKSERSEQEDALVKIKASSAIWTSNYAMVLKRNSISNYLASEEAEQLDAYRHLGYASIGLRTSDYGGTIFTDALLGVEELIALGEGIDNDLYLLQKTRGGYSIYDCKYTYPKGILVDRHNDVIVYEDNPFMNQNRISKAICGKELLRLYEANAGEINFNIDSKSIIYAYVPVGSIIKTFLLTNSENEEVYTKVLDDSGWENGIINLGAFEKENIRITVNDAESAGSVKFAVLSLVDFEAALPQYAEDVVYQTEKNGLTMRLQCDDSNKSLFLPSYCEKGWKCYVNGTKVNIGNEIAGGMVIPVEKGENRVELIYYPPGLWIGVSCTLSTVLLVNIFCVMKKAVDNHRISWLNNGLCFAVYGVWGTAMLVLYVIPFLFLIKFFCGSIFYWIGGR